MLSSQCHRVLFWNSKICSQFFSLALRSSSNLVELKRPHDYLAKRVFKSDDESEFLKVLSGPWTETVNCRYIKTRNNCHLYLLSPKNIYSCDPNDVTKALDMISPDGVALGICLKRFRTFYNAINHKEVRRPTDYIGLFLDYGIPHTIFHVYCDFLHRNPGSMLNSYVQKMFTPAIDYVNTTSNPNVMVTYIDRPYRDVLFDVFFCSTRNTLNLLNYYSGIVTKGLLDKIIQDPNFYRLFVIHRMCNAIHCVRKFSSEVKFSSSFNRQEPVIALILHEWEAQYVANEWKTFFKLNPGRNELTGIYGPYTVLTFVITYVCFFAIVFKIIEFVHSLFKNQES